MRDAQVMNNQSNKAAVVLSVEVVLMRKGGPQYQLVLAKLEAKYGCSIFDCFEHPEYLNEVLKEIYGDGYRSIIEGIQEELGELTTEKDVSAFLDKLK